MPWDFFPWRNNPQCARASSLSGLHNYTQIHHIRWVSSGWVIGPSQITLPDNTQPSQEINFHVPGGIRTRSPSRTAAADPRLRRCGHSDRQMSCGSVWNISIDVSAIPYFKLARQVFISTILAVVSQSSSVPPRKLWVNPQIKSQSFPSSSFLILYFLNHLTIRLRTF